LMFDLEAYWQNRSIASGPGNFTSKETGISNTNSLQLRMLAVESAPSNNTGGLASDPSVYSTVPAPPALQTIVTLNVTSQATLDLLLAALLDNSTGAWNGVNGTFLSITHQVESMGFDAPVLSALADAPVVSQGLYGPPTYSKEPSASGIWGDFWNAVTAVVTTITSAIVSIVGEVYSVAVAAAIYLDRIAHEALEIGGSVLARTAATLGGVGKVIITALNVLLAYISSLVKAALRVAVNPIISAAEHFDSALGASMNASLSYYEGYGTVSTTIASSWAHSFDLMAEFGAALAVAITVVLVLTTPFSLGASSIEDIALSLFPAFALTSMAGLTGGVSSLSSQAVSSLESNVGSRISGIPTVDWETLAALVAVSASVGDGFFAVVTAAIEGAQSSFALTLATSIIIDMIVFAVTILTWASHFGLIAIAALFFAALGSVIAVLALDSPAARLIPTYVTISFYLSLVGLGAAVTDAVLAF